MRVLLMLLFAALAVFSAGCIEDSEPAPEPEPADEGNVTAAPVSQAVSGPQQLPNQGFTVTGAWVAAADPQNFASLQVCSLQTSACDVWDFEVNKTMSLTATLEWGLPANDLDLYLFQNGAEVSRDGINNAGDVPGTSQVLSHELAAGTYQLYVVPWNAVNESYVLDVSLA